jgi:recombinational DNA repair protein RecT
MSNVKISGDKISQWMENPAVRLRLKNCLAGWMDTDEFLSQMEVAFQNPKIKGCTPASKFSVLFQCATLQLLPTFSQIALIPKNGSNLEIMAQWQGYKALMERHPDVSRVDAELVMEGEEYSLDASTGKFTHSFDPFMGRDFEGDLVGLKGGYLRIIFADHNTPDKYHFVTKATICQARSCSRGRDWSQWPKAMVWKTLFKDGFSRRAVPVDPLYNKSLDALDRVDNETMENDPSMVERNNPSSLSSMTGELDESANPKTDAEATGEVNAEQEGTVS